MGKIYIFPLINVVLMPGNIVGIIINDEKLLNNLSSHERKFIASLVKDEKKLELNDYGCLCEIIGMQKLSKNTFILQLKASKRVKIGKIEFDDIYPFTENYKVLEENIEDDPITKEKLLSLAQKYIPFLNYENISSLRDKDLCSLTDIIVSIMKANIKIKQQFLEEPMCLIRAQKLIELLEQILKRWPGKIIILKSFLPKPLPTTIYLT